MKFTMNSFIFIGRDEELEKLNDLVAQDKPIVIYGLGGIGKSLLVKQYIYKHCNDYKENVIWLNATTYDTLSESLNKSVANLIRSAKENSSIVSKFESNDRDLAEVIVDIFNYFTTNEQKSLFVFDNMTKCNDTLKTLISSKSSIIVTSRSAEWPEAFQKMQVNCLKNIDSVAYIKMCLEGSLNEKLDSKHVEQLAETLQNHPLAITQAVCYIEEKRNTDAKFTIKNYLDMYESEEERIILLKSRDFKNMHIASDCNEIKPVWFICETIYNTILSEPVYGGNAIKILQILSCFGKENIQMQIFINFLGLDENNLKLAVTLLAKYSLANFTNEDHTRFTVNKLIQDITYLRLGDKKEQILEIAISLINAKTTSKFIHDDHVMSIWDHARYFDNLMDKYYAVSAYRLKNTPLHIYARYNRYANVNAIIEYYEKFKKKSLEQIISKNNRNRERPLHYAVLSGNVYIVQLLLNVGAHFDARTSSHWTPLHFAVQNNELEIVKCLLKWDSFNVTATTTYGFTPLHTASQIGNIEIFNFIVSMLRERKEVILKEIIVSKTKLEFTPLHLACQHSHVVIVKHLLDLIEECDILNIAINAKTNIGVTPLSFATQKGCVEIVKILFEKGADITSKDIFNNTPFMNIVINVQDQFKEESENLKDDKLSKYIQSAAKYREHISANCLILEQLIVAIKKQSFEYVYDNLTNTEKLVSELEYLKNYVDPTDEGLCNMESLAGFIIGAVIGLIRAAYEMPEEYSLHEKMAYLIKLCKQNSETKKK